MVLFKNISSYFGRRKAKVFLLFLLASFFAWFVSNLSGIYESRVVFKIAYENVPDTLSLGKQAQQQIRAKVRASGFRLLNYNLGPKRIVINASRAQKISSDFIITPNELSRAFERQLSNSVQVIDFESDTLFLDLYQVVKKNVPVQVDINLKLAQNHILEEGIKVTPDTIAIKGPDDQINAIKKVKTMRIDLKDVTSSFNIETKLVRPSELHDMEILENSVAVSGKVMRFSEKVFEVGVAVVDVPDGFYAKTFPDTVSVLCKASINRLKTIQNQDFSLIADFKKVQNNNMVSLQLEKVPENVYDVRLMENQVTLILEER